MRTWAAAVFVVGLVSGCRLQTQDSFACTDDASCGPGGKCEPAFNLCSFADPSCGPDGRSFGGLGGPNSGKCVGTTPSPDGGTDGPTGAGPVCYGAAPFTVCFATAPTGAIDVAMTTTFDTDTSTGTGTQLTCMTPMSGGAGYCVLAAKTITISSPLRATGKKPLVLVAADSIEVPAPASIDISSHRMPTESIGAGGDPDTGCNAGTPPSTAGGGGGGGAGGSFLGAGGNGGNGVSGNGGQRGAAPGIGTVIRGGCPGQDGAGTAKGAPGHGGGAVFLIAGNGITVGGTINAGGEGGAGGIAMASGGGGGGAGGMIGFDAPTIIVTGTLIANGGGGAEGSGNAVNGNPGGDASSTNAAPGGLGGSGTGGDGGNGSAGTAAGPGTAGMDGNASGGGGGGGAGLIKGPPASLGTHVSPAATP